MSAPLGPLMLHQQGPLRSLENVNGGLLFPNVDSGGNKQYDKKKYIYIYSLLIYVQLLPPAKSQF